MRSGRTLLVGLALLAVVPAAHAGRWGFGFYLGGPCYRPCYRPAVIVRPAPIYLAPAPVYVAPSPVVAVAASVPAEPAPPPPPPAPPTLPAPRTVRAARSPDLGALNDPTPQVRAEAILRVGREKDRRAVPVLMRTLTDDDCVAVREAAARALGLIGSAEALPALQHAAGNDRDRDVRKTAGFAAEVIRANLRR